MASGKGDSFMNANQHHLPAALRIGILVTLFLPAIALSSDLIILSASGNPTVERICKSASDAIIEEIKETYSSYRVVGTTTYNADALKKLAIEEDAKLVVALGDAAHRIAKAANLNIPVIMTLSTNGLKDYQDGSKNIFGVHLTPSPSAIVEKLQYILGSNVRKVAYLYSTSNLTALDALDALNKAGKAASVPVTFVGKPVETTDDVKKALSELSGYDALMTSADAPIVQNFKIILRFQIDHKMPVFSPNAVFVKNGLLFGLDVGIPDIALKVAEIAKTIKSKPKSTPIFDYPAMKKANLIVNETVADRMGVLLSEKDYTAAK